MILTGVLSLNFSGVEVSQAFYIFSRHCAKKLKSNALSRRSTLRSSLLYFLFEFSPLTVEGLPTPLSHNVATACH